MFIATIIAPERLQAGDISAAADAVRGSARWPVDGVACDIAFEGDPKTARVAIEMLDLPVDVIVQSEADRRRKLLVADMDSTMITVECIDELADYAGIKAEVSAVTERAMRGEIDFAGALRDRVALLAGMPETTIAECLRERVKIMPGAKALVRTLRGDGGTALLVSGGFTHFTASVAREIGFTSSTANHLIVRDGLLTGEVRQPIVDAMTKRDVLIEAMGRLFIPATASLAIGDGANDISMIEAAGLGVAYHAKPKTRAAADASIGRGNLSAMLYAMGYKREEWVGG